MTCSLCGPMYSVTTKYISGDEYTYDLYDKDTAWTVVANTLTSPVAVTVTLKEGDKAIYCAKGIAGNDDVEVLFK